MMQERMFNGPIPGESLTREPGNAPWEQPPQFARVDEATAFYFDKLEDDKHLEDLLDILEKGMAVEHFVSSLLLYGEMEGKHTTDASLLIAPMLHEYIVFLADSAGIPYKEFQEEEMPDPLAQDFLQTYSPEMPEEDLSETPVEEVIEKTPRPSRGLVKRMN